MMDLAPLVPWITAALAVIALLGHAKNFFGSGEKTLSDRVQKSETKLIEHDRRVQAIEGEMRHLPDRDSAHRLELTMEKISGRLDTLDERLKPIAATSGRLQEFLLEQAQQK